MRTPAVSAAVVDVVAAADAQSLVVFGTGPQGIAHVAALAAIRRLRRVRFVGRDPERLRQACERARLLVPDADVAAGTAAADILVCATTATTPLFDANAVSARTVVVAVGSHEPDKRELPAALLARAQVIVESNRVAATEAGDIILAAREGVVDPVSLVPMKQLFTGAASPASDRPRVVKTCGMGWQDLVIARCALSGADLRGSSPALAG